MTENIDLDKMISEIFGAQKQQEEPMFYLFINEFKGIAGMSSRILDDFKHLPYIMIDQDWFEKLSNDKLTNYIVDEKNKVPVDIAGNQLHKNSTLYKAGKWDSKLIEIQFVKNIRKLHVTVNSQLPNIKNIFVVPRGDYTVPLLTLKLQAAQSVVYDIPRWFDSNSCECISKYSIELFTAYREVEHEADL